MSSSFTTKTITWEGKQVQVLMPRPTETPTQTKSKDSVGRFVLTVFVLLFAMTIAGMNHQPIEAKTTGQIASGVIEYKN